MLTRKFISEFKTGDIVHAHGGRFRIIDDAHESLSHRPMADHLVTAQGPSDCAVAKSVCIEGEIEGYFCPGSLWTFQGNKLAGKYKVELA